MESKNNKLKNYNKPELKVHGNLKKITMKKSGAKDSIYRSSTGP